MISIRPAKIDDVSMVSRIHAFCWRETYSFMPEPVLQSRNREFRKMQWLGWFESQNENEGLFVVEADHDVVGFCFCCPNSDPEINGRGEMHAAYVMPAHRGREVGPVMMLTMLEFMMARELTPPVLWAFRSNPIRLWYAQMGWRSQVKRNRVLESFAVPEVGYVCDDCDALWLRLTRLVRRYCGETALTQTQQHFQTIRRQSRSRQPAASHGNSQTATETGLQIHPGPL